MSEASSSSLSCCPQDDALNAGQLMLASGKGCGQGRTLRVIIPLVEQILLLTPNWSELNHLTTS